MDRMIEIKPYIYHKKSVSGTKQDQLSIVIKESLGTQYSNKSCSKSTNTLSNLGIIISKIKQTPLLLFIMTPWLPKNRKT